MASRFWVGGTGTWDGADTTHWSATSGGAGGASVPGSSDTVTLDGSSGGGTVTVNTTVTVQSITMGAFTGTLDFSANNNNVTLSTSTGMSITGTGTRTLNLGNGTWTLTSTGTTWNATTVTNLTFNANSSTIVFSGTTTATRTFAGGGLTYNNLTVQANTSVGAFNVTGANTFATVTIAAPNYVQWVNSATNTITTLAHSGTSVSAQIGIRSAGLASAATLAVTNNASYSYLNIRDITFTTATLSATSSIDNGGNSGITITAPTESGGGGGRVIGS